MARARWRRAVTRGILIFFAAAPLTQCAKDYRLVTDKPAEAVANETFDFRKWVHEGVEPETVVVAVHGFCGASIDYENLGKDMIRQQPKIAVYAYEVRGQGRDPLKARRGDIDDPKNWFSDLEKFTQKVREEHPKARIVWFGESMGGLIATHAYHADLAAGRTPPCDALVLSSPVVKIRGDFPAWKKYLLRQVAAFIPTARISLEALSGGKPVQMTHTSIHSQQAETNSWHIERHTLRLLVALGDMIDDMPQIAREFKVPVLVLHGGKDFFTSPDDVKTFFANIPDKPGKTRQYYPESFHLLMYDDGKEKVIADIEKWVARLPAKN